MSGRPGAPDEEEEEVSAAKTTTGQEGDQSNSLTINAAAAAHEHSIKLLDNAEGKIITVEQNQNHTANININGLNQGKQVATIRPLQQSDNHDNTQRELEGGKPKSQAGPANISDLIGEMGAYQLSLAAITLVRYICVAMMTNTGPLLAPTLTYWCQPPDHPLQGRDYSLSVHSTNLAPFAHGQTLGINYATPEDLLRDKCQLDTDSGRPPYECTKWTYNRTEFGVTLTDEFDLVCDRSWLKSAFQSAVSFGVVVASVLFGSFSDEHGRRLAMLVCCVISLAAGLISWWAPNFLIYTLARALCSMSDLGLVGSLYTTIVETFGNKYRGPTCLIVFTGWSLGVMIMPWITGYFRDFRTVTLFTVGCHLFTLPWLLTVGESCRWLLVNGRIEEAREELLRISRWNSWWGRRAYESGKRHAELNERFDSLKVKYEIMAREREDSLRASGKQAKYYSRAQVIKRTLFGGLSKVGQIFRSRELTITTAMIIWTTFNSELLYMLFIMINSDVGDNVKLNYAIGGLVETLATLLSIVLIAMLTRRLSLCSTLTTISVSMFCLAFTHAQPVISVYALNFTKLAISTLSSLVYVIVTELFPTSLRQTGMGLAGTLGSLGATIAPFIRTELVDMIGMTSVMLSLCLLPLSAALLIPFFLRETKGVELADDVNDI